VSDDAARRREAELFGRMLRDRRALPGVLEPDPGIDEAGWQPTGEGTPAPETMRRVWTGVGSRETPAEILAVMVDLGARFAGAGWTLRSGAGAGADQAFERGAVAAGGTVEVYLPWAGFNGHASSSCEPPQAAHDLAATIHPAWPRLSDRARRLHARNTQQVLGADLTAPSAFVVCWTPDGAESGAETSRETGGTATAIAVASRRGVPVFNLARAGRVETVDAHALALGTIPRT
jgi:hypothetical protein